LTTGSVEMSHTTVSPGAGASTDGEASAGDGLTRDIGFFGLLLRLPEERVDEYARGVYGFES
jgi:hypothetical protein